MKVGDRVRITDNYHCSEYAKIGETGKIIEFEYVINTWWEGEDSVDYRVLVKLDRKKEPEDIVVSLFLGDLQEVKNV